MCGLVVGEVGDFGAEVVDEGEEFFLAGLGEGVVDGAVGWVGGA